MKRFQLVIPSALLLSFAFTACTDNASEKATTETTDTTAAPVVNTVDEGHQKMEANKKLVTDFYQSLYGDKDSTAIDKYVAENIIQHNPLMEDGREWLKTALQPFLSNPNIQKTKVDIKHIAADGDMVWLYVKDVAPNGKVFGRVDIFRVENGKIAENWKISELVPEKSVNKNTAF